MSATAGPMWGSDGLYVVQSRANGTVAVVRTTATLRTQSTIYTAHAKSLVVLPTTAGLFAFGEISGAPPTLLSIGPGLTDASVATSIQRNWYGALVPVPALG